MKKTLETLDVGARAPEFALKDKDGTLHDLKEFQERHLIVYFYPRDNTPGCTVEAREFTKALPRFRQADAAVIGISGGDEESKTTFCDKNKLNILLLSDPDFAVASSYGAYGEKSFLGKKFKGILRKTFLLDEKRRIVKIYDKVKPAEHPEEILADLTGLQQAAAS